MRSHRTGCTPPRYQAFRKGDLELVDAVYSGIPARMIGRRQEIEIGPMSGKSNVIFWLEERGLSAPPDLVERILTTAKAAAAVLTEEQIRGLIGPAR